MSSWHSYPSIYNLGHKAITNLLTVPVNVEEKIDGSQFSFGLFSGTDAPPIRVIDSIEYGLKVRSKGAVMHPDAPMDMFKKGVLAIKNRVDLLQPGWTYRGELLVKPKHNALAYDRTPQDHVILFDINPSEEAYLSYTDKHKEATRIGLECVPLLFQGTMGSIEDFRNLLNRTSILGGQLIEGMVIKPVDYNLYGLDKKVLMGKFVSEAFKEVHSASWKEDNPTNKDIITLITAKYTNASRWAKAVQHLRDAGLLEDSVKDIGKLIQEVPIDVLKECEEEIKEHLMRHAWPHIKRGLTRGLPEWYKEKLLERQFNQPEI